MKLKKLLEKIGKIKILEKIGKIKTRNKILIILGAAALTFAINFVIYYSMGLI